MKDFPKIGDMVIISEKYTNTEDFVKHYCYNDEVKARFLDMVGKPVRVVGVGEWAYPDGGSSNRCDLSDGSGINTVPLESVEPAFVEPADGDGPDTNVRPPEDDELMETIRETAKACGMTTEEYIRKLCMPVTAGKTQETKPEEISLHYAFDRNLDHAVLFFVENGYKVHLEERDYASIFADRRLVIERRDT